MSIAKSNPEINKNLAHASVSIQEQDPAKKQLKRPKLIP